MSSVDCQRRSKISPKGGDAAEQRVQRRLAAILAADVVGYSRLMREDETGTLAALTAHRKAACSH